MTISHDFFSFGKEGENRNIARFNAFNNEIACFHPGAELIFPLAQSFVVFADDADPDVTPSRFTVTARYNYGEKTVEETTDVDLTAYLMTAPRPNTQLDQLKKIQETLEKLLNRLPSAG